MILGTLAHGPAGFAELRRGVGGISDSVLSERLTELACAGLVARRVNDGPPVTVDYRLTPAGEALLPVLGELTIWARDNLPAKECAGQGAPRGADPMTMEATGIGAADRA